MVSCRVCWLLLLRFGLTHWRDSGKFLVCGMVWTLLLLTAGWWVLWTFYIGWLALVRFDLGRLGFVD